MIHIPGTSSYTNGIYSLHTYNYNAFLTSGMSSSAPSKKSVPYLKTQRLIPGHYLSCPKHPKQLRMTRCHMPSLPETVMSCHSIRNTKPDLSFNNNHTLLLLFLNLSLPKGIRQPTSNHLNSAQPQCSSSCYAPNAKL